MCKQCTKSIIPSASFSEAKIKSSEGSPHLVNTIVSVFMQIVYGVSEWIKIFVFNIFAIQISEALSFLHNSEMLIHGNVSPQSVIITKRGTWKLAGMGFAEKFRDGKASIKQMATK